MAFVKAGLWGPQAIIDSTGHPQPGAIATVYLTDGVTLASLWTSSAKAVVMANPTQADVHGNLHFYTDPGPYMLKMLIGTVVTWLDVEVPIDPGEAAQDSDVAAALAAAEAYADGIVIAGMAGKQPLDSDLTAIAALTTTVFGRSFLVLADAAAGQALLALGTAATQPSAAFDAAGAAAAAQAASQPLDSDLTAIAALSTTAFGRSVLALADAAAMRTLAGVVIGTDVQAHDADLDAIAAVTTTVFGRALLALADAAALRTAAGLGTAAVAATTDFDAAGTAAAAVSALVSGAPGALDTLNELATALGDDAAFATTVTNALATKLIAGATSGTANQAALPAAVAHTHEVVKTDDAGVYVSTGSSWVEIVPPSLKLAPTAVKTGNYTAAAGDYVLCDTSGGIFTVTLPTAPADKTSIAVDLITSGNTLTIARGGADVFQKAGGPATMTLNTANRVLVLQYQSATAVWHVQDHLPAIINTKGDLLTYSTERARLPVGINGQVLTVDSTQTLGIKWATASGGAGPLGEIDTTLAPYSVVANDTSSPVMTQNVIGIAQAITDAAGAKWIVLPPGITYINWATDPGPSGFFSGQGYAFSTSGSLYIKGAVRGGVSKIAFPQTGAHPSYRNCMFRSSGTTSNLRFQDLEFVGPATMPSPFPSFRRYENFYLSKILEWNTGGGSLLMENCRGTGWWGFGPHGLGAAGVTGSSARFVNCDFFAIDSVLAHFVDESYAADTTLEVLASKCRSHQFTTRRAVTAATYIGSALTITTNFEHRMAVNDKASFLDLLPGLTSMTVGPYTVVSVTSPYTFTITVVGVGGAYTSGGTVRKVTDVSFGVAAVSVSGSTVTVTTSQPMDLFGTAGGNVDTVMFHKSDGTGGLDGLSGLSLSYTVQTVTDSTHFTITQAGVTGSYTGSSTVRYDWELHGLCGYAGVSVATRISGCEFWDGAREAWKNFTSSAPASTPPGSYYEIIDSLFATGGDGYQTANINNVHTLITGCTFRNDDNAVNISSSAGSTVHIANCDFKQGKTSVFNAGNAAVGVTIEGCHFATSWDPDWTSQPGFSFGASTGSVSFKMSNCFVEHNRSLYVISMPNRTDAYCDLVNVTFTGGALNTGGITVVPGGYTRLRGCRFLDRHDTIFQFNNANVVEVEINDCDFLESNAGSGGVFFSLTNGANKVRGRGNTFGTHVPSWSTSATGPRFKTREGTDPANVTAAANTSLGMNYDTHHITAGGATTINNLWIGGSANSNRCFGGTRITLIFNDANSTLSNSAGNIRLRGGANVTPAANEVRSFVFDQANDLWRETASAEDPTIGGVAIALRGTGLPAFFQQGTLTVKVGAGRFPILENCTIKGVIATVGTAPTGAAVLVDVNQNGTTVFTTQGNRPSIAIAGFASTVAVPDVVTLTAGDYLSVDIDQVGSTIAGADLTVTIELAGR